MISLTRFAAALSLLFLFASKALTAQYIAVNTGFSARLFDPASSTTYSGTAEALYALKFDAVLPVHEYFRLAVHYHRNLSNSVFDPWYDNKGLWEEGETYLGMEGYGMGLLFHYSPASKPGLYYHMGLIYDYSRQEAIWDGYFIERERLLRRHYLEAAAVHRFGSHLAFGLRIPHSPLSVQLQHSWFGHLGGFLRRESLVNTSSESDFHSRRSQRYANSSSQLLLGLAWHLD